MGPDELEGEECRSSVASGHVPCADRPNGRQPRWTDEWAGLSVAERRRRIRAVARAKTGRTVLQKKIAVLQRSKARHFDMSSFRALYLNTNEKDDEIVRKLFGLFVGGRMTRDPMVVGKSRWAE